MGKKSKLINKVMKSIDKELSERNLDDDYEWYFAKKTSVSDDPIILIEFPDNITRGFDVEWEDSEEDWKSIAELVTTQIMDYINEFEATRNIDRATRPIINFEQREDILINRYNESFDEEAYEGAELNYRDFDEPEDIEPFTDELASMYFNMAQEEPEL